MLKSFIIYSIIITGLVFIENHNNILNTIHISILFSLLTSPIFIAVYAFIDEFGNSPRNQ